MKRITTTFTLLLLFVASVMAQKAWNGTDSERWSKGAGTSSDPYLIESAEQLAFLSQSVREGESYEDQYFRLVANVDLNNQPFMPIGIYNKYTEQKEGEPEGITKDESRYFKGVFDGNFHTIDHLFINHKTAEVGSIEGNASTLGGIGLFACAAPKTVIRNLIIGKHSTISTEDNVVGTLIGAMEGGMVENCINYAKVKAVNYVGGIVGYMASGKVKSCANRSEIQANWELGGIVGHIEGNAIVVGCANTGVINGSYMNAGGIAGSIYDEAVIGHCYNAATVKDPNTMQFMGLASGIVSGTDGNKFKVEHCFIVEQISAADSRAKVVTLSEMKDPTFISTINAGSNDVAFAHDSQHLNDGFPIMAFELNNSTTGIARSVMTETNYVINGRTIKCTHSLVVYNLIGQFIAKGTTITLSTHGTYLIVDKMIGVSKKIVIR